MHDTAWHDHARYAASAFGADIPPGGKPAAAALPLPGPGRILAVVGPSGSGKSLALQGLLASVEIAREVRALTRRQLSRPVLSLFGGGIDSEAVLRGLARAGLAEPRLWNMPSGQLSSGEQRRLELALALAGAPPGSLLVADEFDAHLDSLTARLVAQNLRRMVQRGGHALAVSTHRPEVLAHLAPDTLLEIDGPSARELPRPAQCDLLREVEVTRGRLRDYSAFERWHYLGPGLPGPSSDVFVARHDGRAVGIALFGYPHLLLARRAGSLPQFAPAMIRRDGAAALNRDVRLLQRVVVDPRWRGIGLARLLIRHGLEHVGARWVECVAQMGAFSDFLLAAGFERVGEVDPPAAVARLTGFCASHGIDTTRLLTARRRAALARELPGPQAMRLMRLISAVVRGRIQTGNGSRRRGRGELPEAAMRKAMSRLHARPTYFLWTQGAQP
jgi:ABC-type nitrate/sulfonate/bicarbonate transport system ATPase subunit